jgi:aspartyl-tRNA(Asn)/glutamyl-tRNA(Gln) amidotransferase subunit A
VHADVAAALEAAVLVLDRLGAVVTEVDPGFTLPRDDFLTIWDALLSQPLLHVPEDRWHLSDPGLVKTTRRGRSLTASALLQADGSRLTMMAALERVLADHDVIISPQMPCAALPLGRDLPDRWNADMRLEHWIDWSPFTYPLNLTRHPAASVPIGFDGSRMPIAMQVIGAHFDDRRVMRVARAFEREQPFPMPDRNYDAS